MSQRRSNRSQAVEEDVPDLDEPIKECVRYIVCREGSKIPIKRSDIVKHLGTVCQTPAKLINNVILGANNIVKKVYGYKLIQVESKSGVQYIVVLSEPCESLSSSATDFFQRKMLIAALTHIFMTGSPVKEEDMWKFLEEAGLLEENDHAGRKVLTTTFTRQLYLSYSKDYMNHLDTSFLHRFLATEAPEESPTNWAWLFFWCKMSKPIYHYFHCKALGEGPRMLMAYGDYEFEDVRHFLADFPEFKPKTPFGQLPMLIVDGNEYAQSMALSRYFGRKFGLAGDNDEEALEVDSIAEFLNDIRAKAAMVFYEADEERKVARNADFHKNVYPALLGKLASIAEKNNGHLALGRLTWADFSFTGVFDYLKTMMQVPDLEDRYPVFKRVHQSVLTIPKVKKFVDNAPLSEPALPF